MNSDHYEMINNNYCNILIIQMRKLNFKNPSNFLNQIDSTKNMYFVLIIVKNDL